MVLENMKAYQKIVTLRMTIFDTPWISVKTIFQ